MGGLNHGNAWCGCIAWRHCWLCDWLCDCCSLVAIGGKHGT
nr:MAG TPA: hypothetical protein [Caudoviricetes sp.]